MVEKKGKKPDYIGDGMAIWCNTDRNGNEYLSTGSGKTTTLKVFAFQQKVNPNEPRVVFDYKEDWKEFYTGGS